MKALRMGTAARFALLGASVIVGSLVAWRELVRDGNQGPGPGNRVHPALFQPERQCPDGSGTLAQALRLERHGHFHAERYPYDAKDGVRAVHRFQEAASCHRARGSEPAADRAQRLASQLTERIDVDYASARLVLMNALEKEQWSLAHAEVRRLRALTAHLASDRYVDWLREISGKVAVHAGAIP